MKWQWVHHEKIGFLSADTEIETVPLSNDTLYSISIHIEELCNMVVEKKINEFLKKQIILFFFQVP